MRLSDLIPGFLRASDAPSELQLDAELNFQAAKAEGEAPTFSLIANTGVPMEVSGFIDPVVVDLAGARFAKKRTPVIMDHDTAKRIGFTTSQTVEANRIIAEGRAVTSMGVAAGFVQDAKDGFPFQVSIGASVKDAEFVPEGEKVEVNGRSVRGPVIVARKTLIRELSVTVLGADGNTSAKVAARRRAKGEDMDFNAWLTAKGFDPEKLEDKQQESLKAMWEAESKEPDPKPDTKLDTKPDPKTVTATGDDDAALNARRKLEADETARVDSIKAHFSRYETVKTVTLNGKETSVDEFKISAIRDGLDPRDVELELMRSDRPKNLAAKVHVTRDMEAGQYGEALACSVARSLGMRASAVDHNGRDQGYEHVFDEQVLNAVDKRLNNVSLHQLMDIAIQAATGTTYNGNRKSDDFIRSYLSADRQLQASGGPFSTLTVTNILENVANKMLLARFAMQMVTWPMVAQTVVVNDFKAHSRYRLSENLGYLKVGPTGSLKSGELADTKRTISAETFGRLISLTRTHLRNDDLSAFGQIINGLADGSAWAIEAEFWEQVLAQINGAAFFTSALGNLISDDLTIAGLTAAETAFMNRVGEGGKPIVTGPNRLVVGTQDSVLADQLRNDSTVVSTTIAGGFESNPHAGKYGKVVTPYLNNTALRKPDGSAFTGQSSDHWLLIGDPSAGAIAEVALLDGRAVPFIEQAETSFDTLGIQFRGYHDFGVAAGDEEFGVLSLGDDSSV